MDALPDIAGIWIGVVLTLFVLTYLVKDNVMFRLAQSLLVGTAIGYGSAVILNTVLWKQLLVPLVSDFDHYSPLLLPLLLGVGLVVFKLLPGWSGSFLGNISLGYLFGIGAALAIGGAVNSVLAKQVGQTILGVGGADILGWINSLIILVGTLGALLSFRFTTEENNRVMRLYSRLAQGWGRIGRGFIMIAFGAILANVLAARIAALVGQLYFIFHDALSTIIK
ncbi:MAG: hypothetical protein WCF84_08780 [Anaerolineae bacterium]